MGIHSVGGGFARDEISWLGELNWIIVSTCFFFPSMETSLACVGVAHHLPPTPSLSCTNVPLNEVLGFMAWRGMFCLGLSRGR